MLLNRWELNRMNDEGKEVTALAVLIAEDMGKGDGVVYAPPPPGVSGFRWSAMLKFIQRNGPPKQFERY